MLAALPAPLRRAATANAAIAAATALALAMAVALASWIVASNGTGSGRQALAAGMLAVLGACHGGMTINGDPMGFVPLGATLLVAVPCWRSGAVLGSVAGRELDRRTRLLLLCRSALAFGLVMAVLALIVHVGDNRADRLWTGFGAFALYLAAAAVPFARATAPVLSHGEVSPFAVIARAGAAALAVLLGCSALLAGAALIHGAGRARELSEAVGGGGASGLPLALIGVLSVPNAVIAGLAYLAGPGFAVGAGTTFSAGAPAVGAVPAFPLLAALPQGGGATAPVTALMIVAFVGAGVAAVLVLMRQLPYPGPLALLLGALGAAGLTGLASAILAWLAGGGLGSGRLATVGASPLQVGLRTAGQVLAVSLIALAGVAAVRFARRLRRPETTAAGDAALDKTAADTTAAEDALDDQSVSVTVGAADDALDRAADDTLGGAPAGGAGSGSDGAGAGDGAAA